MAAPAILLSEDGKTQEKVKVSAALLLVRRLTAVEIKAKKLYQRVSARTVKEIAENPRPFIPDTLPANIDSRLGVVLKFPILQNQVRFRALRQSAT